MVSALLLLGLVAFWPSAAGGSTSFVTTTGNSMAPRLQEGDLVVVRRAPSYEVGDAVAYHSDTLDTTVLHRIVARQGGRFVLQGDNNDFLDPDEPTPEKIIGRQWLHVPGGGVWLDRATHPLVLALLTFGLLAGGTLTELGRRRKRPTMSRHRSREGAVSSPPGQRPPHGGLAAGLAGIGVVALLLAFLAWSRPATHEVTQERPSDRQVTFSYSAEVSRSAAYDGTRVRSPRPVFRALTERVVVRYAYRGGPGRVTVTAELSAANGWHSSVPLTGPTSFTGEKHTRSVVLDLRELDERAQRAAGVIGVPVDDVTVTIRPRFELSDGSSFAPELPLLLTANQLSIGQDTQLHLRDPAMVARTVTAPRSLEILGRTMPVTTARILSTVVLAMVMLASLVLAGLARRAASRGEAENIRRRYAGILVPVHPMPTTPGRPVVDVTEFSTLVKLAERYGLLVLHWDRAGVHTFIVHDQGTTYRYRTADRVPQAEPDTVTVSEQA